MTPPRTIGVYGKARAALAPFQIAGTAPEPAFDIFVQIVCAALDVPSALLGFFDGDVLSIKAVLGTLHRDEAVARQLRESFEHERPIVTAGDEFFCAAPVFAPNGTAVGVIAGFGGTTHTSGPAVRVTMETIALAVTHALDARRHTSSEPPRARALVAFDTVDFSVLFADAETVRQRYARHEELQSLTFDDVFIGIDEGVRSDLDAMRATMDDRSLTFEARTLGPIGFWYQVTCTARAVRARSRSVIVVEFVQPGVTAERQSDHALALQTMRRARWHGHSIETVLAKIEAGRRALRVERGEIDEPLTGDAFVSRATHLLADTGEPHVLAIFALGRDAIGSAIDRARRSRLLCDRDLVAVLEGDCIALLLRDMPAAIAHRAIERFARSFLNARFTIRDIGGPDASVQEVLADALAGLRATE